MKFKNFYSTKYRHDYLAIAIYGLLTLALTYPVPFRLMSHIAGFAGEDNLQWRWFLWWFKHALLNLHTSPTHVSLLYAPTGGEQSFYAITSFIPAAALPFTLLGGPTVSFNLSFLLSFILSGYTAYLLGSYLTHNRLTGFLAGLIFAFYPARFGYATGTFLGQLTTYLLPLYVMTLFMLVHRPSWRRAGWLALVLAGLCLTWPLHVAYGVVLFTFPFMIVQLVRWLRWAETRHSIRYFALAYGLALVLIIGFYMPLLHTFLTGKNYHIADTNSTFFALDLLAFLTPSNYHPVLTRLGVMPAYVHNILADQNDIQERLGYLGLIPVILAGIGLARFGRRLLFWLVVALIAMVLSLGPLLKFNGNLVQLNIEGYVGYIVLPYALLRSMPILDWSGVLGRLNVVTMLSLAVMAAYGLSYLLSKVKDSRRPGITVALAVVILLEYWTISPFPTEADTVPIFYDHLRQEATARPQTIIDLPLLGSPSYTNYSMHFQTVHQQPVAGGHFMRKPGGAREMTAFLHHLLLPLAEQFSLVSPDADTRLGLLHHFGFTKVVARLWLMQDPAGLAQLAHLSGWLGQPYLEGEVAVFELPPGGHPPEPVVTLFAEDGWVSSDDGKELQLQSPADMLVYVDTRQTNPLALELSVTASEPERYLAVAVNNLPTARLYLSPERLDYTLPVALPPGFHQVTFFPEETCRESCAPVSFSKLTLQNFKPETVPLEFDNQLALIHYTLSGVTLQPSQPLLIYLYWQGQGPMEADYGAFVHLVSPSGERVGQVDTLLGGWLLPTSAWPERYIFAAPALLFVPPDAAPGQYQVQVGVYNSETGERLRLGPESTRADFALLSTLAVMSPPH